MLNKPTKKRHTGRKINHCTNVGADKKLAMWRPKETLIRKVENVIAHNITNDNATKLLASSSDSGSTMAISYRQDDKT
jgi:hypothetical protein